MSLYFLYHKTFKEDASIGHFFALSYPILAVTEFHFHQIRLLLLVPLNPLELWLKWFNGVHIFAVSRPTTQEFDAVFCMPLLGFGGPMRYLPPTNCHFCHFQFGVAIFFQLSLLNALNQKNAAGGIWSEIHSGFWILPIFMSIFYFKLRYCLKRLCQYCWAR